MEAPLDIGRLLSFPLPGAASPWLLAALGLALLFFGRRVFWLTLGAVGFVSGAALAWRFFPAEDRTHVLIAAAVAGVVGILLAVFLQKLAVAVGGFLVGGWAALWLVAHGGAGAASWPPWLVFLAGGVVAALLARLLFNWALVGVSAVAGALLLVQLAQLGPALSAVLTAVLALLGAIVQLRSRRQKDGRAYNVRN